MEIVIVLIVKYFNMYMDLKNICKFTNIFFNPLYIIFIHICKRFILEIVEMFIH